tara:strand:+ start:2136 stop:3626 length:1491 start_codon:yes stop_codon:yes gene_type:complete
MPLIDLANPLESQALAQLAGPFGGYLNANSFPSSYGFAKRFVNNAKTANGSGSNGVTSLDDPTYLGFELEFDITSPLFNGATRGNTGITNPVTSPPPTVGGDLKVSQKTGASSTEGGGSSDYAAGPSAIGYLNKIGEANRAEYLKAFIQGIQEVNKERPYYFQTITGLLEAWNKSIEFTDDPYTGTTGTDGITVGCLEAIDLKITALFTLYKMAVFDARYKRFVLPKNLLRFDVYVSVQEIRKFKTVRNWLGALNPNLAEPDTKAFVNENTSQIRFRFIDCIFDAGASGKLFDGVTNTGYNVAVTEMKWSYSLMENISQFSGYNTKLDEGKTQASTDPSFAGKIKQFGKDQLANAAAGAVNLAVRTVSSAIQGLTLGNVFGLRNELLGVIANPQGLINAAAGAALQGGALQTFEGQGGIKNISDNAMGRAVPRASSLTGDDPAFEPALPRKSSLSGTNPAFDDTAPVNDRLNGYNAFGAPGPTQDNGGLSSTNIFN